MIFNLNNLTSALSYALDFIEIDLMGGVTDHSRRVAYIALRLSEQLALPDKERFDIAALSILHDNGIGAAFQDLDISDGADISHSALDAGKRHCIAGENNLKGYPFLTDCTNIIKYHHENADGSGLFHLSARETPLASRIIHFADFIELQSRLESIDYNGKKNLLDRLSGLKGTMLDADLIEAFKAVSGRPSFWLDLQSKFIIDALHRIIPVFTIESDFIGIRNVTHIFSRIIDSKSQFTRLHSQELSEKAGVMAQFYGYDPDTTAALQIAADLHDIGKLAISNRIIDKPGKLDMQEIDLIQSHTYFTRISLQPIEGFEEITEWAANHHEKIDGSGYPCRSGGELLNFNSRLMCCLDIYQALTELRPYRTAMSHVRAMEILNDMSDHRKIDGGIVSDIGKVFS